MPESKPVIEGLFRETAEGPRLVGSRCTSCDVPYFPQGELCHNPDCDSSKMQEALFGASGKVWSIAIQDYPPPPPAKYDEPYKPYAMGVVDLDDGLRVMGRITGEDPHSIQPGAAVELVLDPLYHEEDGTPVITWKFKPL